MRTLLPASVRTRIQIVLILILVGAGLFAGFRLLSPHRAAVPATASNPPLEQAIATNPAPADDGNTPAGSRLIFSTEELSGKTDAASSGALVLDAMGNGRPALLVWSDAGVQLFADGSTPVTVPEFSGVREVRDIQAADFNNDGFADLCVVMKHHVRLFVNGPHGFTQAEAGEFWGEFTQALWLDYDHDGDTDLILLGKHPLVLRNQKHSRFAPRRGAIPFLPGEALAAVVIRDSAVPAAFDFLVSYANRSGVYYRDHLGGRYSAEDLPELPPGAAQLRSGELTGRGNWNFSYLLGEDATLMERSGSTWEKILTVPAGHSYLFGDFANLGTQDWLADGILLAGGSANFSQSRDMPTAPANYALVAADFDRDGKLDFAGVGPDGTILRCLNRSPSTGHWLRIHLATTPGGGTVRGAMVSVQTPAATQRFAYSGNPLHVGTGSFDHAKRIQILWPSGTTRADVDQPADSPYTYVEPLKHAGPGAGASSTPGARSTSALIPPAPLGFSTPMPQ